MGWFSSSDKDDDNKQSDFFSTFQSSFSTSGSSVSKVCRPDKDDNNFLVCKIKETKTQNVNGENVTNTEEREERVPVNQQQGGLFQFPFGDHRPIAPFTRSDEPQSREEELKLIEDQFANMFNSFFGGSNNVINEVFREIDRGFRNFPQTENMGNPNSNPRYYQQPPNEMSQNFENKNSQPKYDYSFRKTPHSDKDVFDV